MDRKEISESLKQYMEELKNDFKNEFKMLRDEYKRDFQSLQTKVKEMRESMCTKTELRAVESTLLLEVAGVRTTVDDVSTKFNTLRREYDEKIQ